MQWSFDCGLLTAPFVLYLLYPSTMLTRRNRSGWTCCKKRAEGDMRGYAICQGELAVSSRPITSENKTPLGFTIDYSSITQVEIILMVLTCNLMYLWYMYISYLRYPELIFKGRPLLDLEWLWVGYQVRAASNGELEDFKKDGMKVTGGPRKNNRKCSDLSSVPSALTWQWTWQWHSVFFWRGGWWLKVVRECFNHDVWTTSRRTR